MTGLLVKAASSFSVSLIATFLLLPRLAVIATRLGLIDHPNKRKVHKVPKPLVGGMAMASGVVLSSLIFINITNLRGFFLGFTILLLVGFLDDFKELNHRLKFVAQFLAVSLIIFIDGARLENLGELLPGIMVPVGHMVVPLTMISAVGVINAVNMSDGLDGLAGGLSLIAFAAFSALAYLNGQPQLMFLSLAFCGALVVFLKYNWQPASLFMGDAGSLVLGFSLAFFAIMLSQSGRGLVPPISTLLIMAVPVTDTLTVMTKRLMRKKSPFRADKTHFHHLLLRCGFSKKLSVVTITTISLLLSVIGVAGAVLNIQQYDLIILFLGYFGCYLFFVFYATKILRAKLRITKGRAHGSGRLVSSIAGLLELIERISKIRWEGFQFNTAIPTPCLMKRSGEQIAGALKNLSAKGFSITSCESLTLGEELDAGIFVRDGNQPGNSRDLDLSITAEVIGARKGNEEFEYRLRFSNIDKNASQKITRFLERVNIQHPTESADR